MQVQPIVSEEYIRSEPLDSPLQELWESNYPIEYWDNRIHKLNPYNTEDGMEALFALLQLVDTYVHILSAKLRDPYYLWYTLKEDTYKPDIDETLDVLKVDDPGVEDPYYDIG